MNGYEDARLLLQRARKHEQELYSEMRKLWRVQRIARIGDQYRYRLTFHREGQPGLRPIAADIANNLRHSLDHLAAEAARQHLDMPDLDHQTRQKIKFPFPRWDDSLELSVAPLAPYVSKKICDQIEMVWRSPVTHPYYLHVVRVVSGAAKHWELRSIEPRILALQPVPSEGPPIAIPKGHFDQNNSFEWKGSPMQQLQTLERMQFGDVSHRPANIPMPPNPDTVFSTTSTYVQHMIEAFEAS